MTVLLRLGIVVVFLSVLLFLSGEVEANRHGVTKEQLADEVAYGSQLNTKMTGADATDTMPQHFEVLVSFCAS